LESGGRGDYAVEGVRDELGVKECVEGVEVDEDGFEELGSREDMVTCGSHFW
jgi:hypothetical protein